MMRLWLWATLVTAAAIVAGLGIAVRLYMGRAAQDRLAPGESVEITALRPPLPQNGYLACPPGACAGLEAAVSPVFEMPLSRLRERWQQLIAEEPRVVPVATAAAQDRFVYIQHTPLLRFPDIVTVELVALGAGRSSLAIYSRARYGRSDFGTNRKRVETWLARLSQLAAG